MDENNLIKMKEFLCFSQNTHVYIHKSDIDFGNVYKIKSHEGELYKPQICL